MVTMKKPEMVRDRVEISTEENFIGLDEANSNFEPFSDDEESEHDDVGKDEHESSESSEDEEVEVEDSSSEVSSDSSDVSESSDADILMDDTHTEGKDPAEEELEKLVLGDSVGFREAIASFTDEFDGHYTQTATHRDLSTIPDSDLFYIDTEPSDALTPADQKVVKEDSQLDRRAPPAWQDSDDERIRVSLMAVPRLRKLRNYEGEDVISGKEYQHRLRRQYEALHPPPAWAKCRPENSAAQHPKKRRKLSAPDRNSDVDSDSAASSGADVSMDDDDDTSSTITAPSLSELLKSTAPFLRTTPDKLHQSSIPRLKPEVIDIDRLPDIVPSSSPQPHAPICLSLHPTLPLLISAGVSGMLYMHHIQPRPPPPTPPNPLVTSLHMRHTHMSTAVFSPLSGTDKDPKIYMASGRRSFHTWTLPTGAITKTSSNNFLAESKSTQRRIFNVKPSPCGRWLALQGTARKGGGVVNVLSASSLQWVAQARGEGKGGLADFCWWGDGDGLTLVGKLGEVCEWSVERGVVGRWTDEGGVGVACVVNGADPDQISRKKKGKRRVLGSDRWTVLGTQSGFVTIYDRYQIDLPNDDGKEKRDTVASPKPLATLDNLTTAITHLAISPCGQLLAFASKWKRDALRLVHLSSGKVYRNWPTDRTPFGRICSLVVGECEGVVQGEEDGKGLIVVTGNEQGIIRSWIIQG